MPVDEARVRAALDEIRPGLLADGGNVELSALESDGGVRIELQGECSNCPARALTVKRVILPTLMRRVPGITALRVD